MALVTESSARCRRISTPSCSRLNQATCRPTTALFEIERSLPDGQSDLQARPIYHRKRDSIDAHLTIVFTALAVSRWIERQTGSSIRKFVKTARRYRIIQIQAGPHTITAADPILEELRQAFEAINRAR